MWPDKSMEPTGASGSFHFEGFGQWPLAPAAHARRCPSPPLA
jgi:hypothetical protein